MTLKPADILALQYNSIGISYTREYKFHPTRKWRFDYAWPDIKFAVEVEGGLYVMGRHSRGAGYEKDLEKYSEAMVLGWQVLRVSNKLINSGRALEITQMMIDRLINPNAQS
jgi:very-short-patch-repair endonuclease